MKNKLKNSKASNYLRMLALSAVLVIVTVVVIIAYDAYEYGYYGEAPVYTYDWSERYIDYVVDEYIYDEDNYMHTPPPPAYSSEYGYEYDYYSAGYYYYGYAHEHHYYYAEYYYSYEYEYVEGGYIGYAPSYIGIIPASFNDIIYPTLVANQTQLQNVINSTPASATDRRVIRISQDFTINQTQPIRVTGGRNILITSANEASPRTITRAFPGAHGGIYLSRHFRVYGAGSSLGIRNIILDGHNGIAPPPPGQHSGGVAVMHNANFYMYTGSVIQNSRSQNSGGGVRAVDNGTFTMFGGIIQNNGTSTLGGGGFANNSAADLGGPGHFIMYDGLITGNHTANTDGGGVRVSGGSGAMHGGTIENNFAPNGGGGLFVGSTNFIMTGGTIRNNRYAAPDSNTPIAVGGGVQITNATFTMTGGTIGHPTDAAQGNQALQGGGVWVGNGASFIMEQGGTEASPTQGRITGNVAPTAALHLGGGGVYVTGQNSTFYMSAGSIDANRAFRGTGVHLINQAYFTMTGGYIRNHRWNGNLVNPGNIQYAAGVMLYVESTFTMTGGRIYNNNYATYNGPVIRIDSNSTVNMSGNARIHDNRDYGTDGGGTVRLGSNQNATLNMSGNARIDNNFNGGGSGGGVSLGTTSTFNMSENARIDNNTSPQGGGVFLTGNANAVFNMYGGTIEQNRSPLGGGVSSGGTFNMHGGTIRNNRYASTNLVTGAGTGIVQFGGGVRVVGANSTFTMTGGMIGGSTSAQGNQALMGGGGVWVGNGASFYMQDYTYVDDNGDTVTIPGTGQISGNTNTGTATNLGGGGVMVTGPNSTFVMESGTIGGPTVSYANSSRRGGGVLVVDQGVFTMVEDGNGVIERNTTFGTDFGGGGVFVVGDYSTFNMYSGVIRYHVIDDNGGGVRISDNSIFNMSGNARIHNNTSSQSGAGGLRIISGSTFNMSGNARIDNNITTGDAVGSVGGGISLSSFGVANLSGNARIDNNVAEVNAGGVFVGSSATVNMFDNAVIESNRAPIGGGVAVFSNNARFNMHGGTIRNHRYATLAGGAITNGGGVWVNQGNRIFTMTGGMIGCNLGIGQGNIAYAGGGVWVGSGATFNMNPGSVTVDDVAIPTYGTITGNTATLDTLSDSGGGGVHVTDIGSTFNMRAGVIGATRPVGLAIGVLNPHANNAANGGGVWVGNGATFNMLSGEDTNDQPTYGTIRGNNAVGTGTARGGGGVYAFLVNSTINIEAGVIEYNTSNENGGGIGVHHGLLNLNVGGTLEDPTSGIIHNNTSNANGGGVNMSGTANAIFTMHGGAISGNSSGVGNIGTGGGGIRITGGHFIMNGGEIYGNTAYFGGGGGVSNNSTMTMNDGVIRDNYVYGTAGGGGVRVTSADFTMNGGRIENNVSSTNGGGISQNSASTTRMYGGIIYGNEAALNGGGIHTSGPFLLRGTDIKNIQNNEAEYDGGGVWVAQDGAFRMETTATHPIVNNIHITHNTAGRMGGGIYTQRHEYYNDPLTLVSAPANPGGVPNAYSNLTLHGVTFGNNSANRRYWPPSNATAVIPTTAFVASSTSQPTSIPDIRRHPLNNYDINFRIGLVDFDFLKTDNYLYASPPSINLLPGAQFRLYRTIDPGAPIGTSGADLVMYNAGVLDPRWEQVIFTDGVLSTDYLVATSTASASDIISFRMDPRHYYQLVEIVAPPGFAPPMGQWRITYSMSANAFNAPITVGGTNIPIFLRSDLPALSTATHPVTPRDNLFYVGNWRSVGLPMTGGTGISMPVFAGTALLGVALILLAAILIKKARQHS